MMIWNQCGYQDCSSSLMVHMVKFYDYAFLVVFLIIALVSFIMFSMLKCSYSCRYIVEAEVLEVIWSVLPAFFLIFIAMPSLRLLYLTDEVVYPFLTIKAIGHQWYWSYVYFLHYESGVVDYFNGVNTFLFYNSVMCPFDDLILGEARLLEVDNRLVLPMNQELNVQVTAADVIHCWAIPSLGVKIDAVPGRLNSFPMFILSPGSYFGLCSEICGVNHSFMPIGMEVISVNSFFDWAAINLFI